MERIFIVGCPRSGTTLLQSMLVAAGSWHSVPETRVLLEGIGRGGRQLFALGRRVAVLRQLATACGAIGWAPGIRDRFWIRMRQKRFLREMVALLDHAAQERGLRGWIEKTPGHIFFIPTLEVAVPVDIKFIHIVRDGRATAASILHMWSQFIQGWSRLRLRLMAINDVLHIRKTCKKYGDVPRALPWTVLLRHRRLVRAIELWNDALLMSQACQGQPGHFVCHYEDLTAEPEPVLHAICEFLGIEYSPKMLAFQATARGLIRRNEPWKQATLGRLRSASMAKFNSLDPEAKQLACHLLLAQGNAKEFLR